MVEGEKKITIKNIDYSQHNIIYNIINMHNEGNAFDCDMTYSRGNFYGVFNITDIDGNKKNIEIPQPSIKMDVYPQYDNVVKLEPTGNIPLKDNNINSIMVDLPFVISPPNAPSMKEGKKGSNIIANRFASYYPISDLIYSYMHWMSECYRVLKEDGVLVWKTQNTITGSRFLPTEELSWLFAEQNGFEVLDKFTLLAKQRLISGKVKQQQHARNYSSTFWVFKKSKKKSIRYFDWMTDDAIEKFNKEVRNNWVNKKRLQE